MKGELGSNGHVLVCVLAMHVSRSRVDRREILHPARMMEMRAFLFLGQNAMRRKVHVHTWRARGEASTRRVGSFPAFRDEPGSMASPHGWRFGSRRWVLHLAFRQ